MKGKKLSLLLFSL